MEERVREHGLPQDAAEPAQAEGHGLFRRRGSATLCAGEAHRQEVRASVAQRLGVRPVFKRIDTCAAEFDSPTAYMYSTYEAPFVGEAEHEAESPTARRSSSSAAGRTASARASSSTIAAAMPASR